MVDGIVLDLTDNFESIGKCLGDVGENLVHLGCRLHPLLLSVVHSVRVGQVRVCRDTDKAVVGFGVFLVGEVDVVCGHDFYVEFARNIDQHRVDLLLNLIDGVCGARFVGLVAL